MNTERVGERNLKSKPNKANGDTQKQRIVLILQ
jgi:hypothetical protein